MFSDIFSDVFWEENDLERNGGQGGGGDTLSGRHRLCHCKARNMTDGLCKTIVSRSWRPGGFSSTKKRKQGRGRQTVQSLSRWRLEERGDE